jgi:hypothetical protein
LFTTFIVVLLVIIFVYSRYNGKKRRRHKRSNGANDDDVRENIVRYTDEGGEDDIKAYDMTSLRIQITGNNCVDSFHKTDNYRTRIARKSIFVSFVSKYIS